ncbi:phosphatase 2C-like domain-containing protein [Globomyces pollinis-pini]|nr:phosphatase 2C-like domain-containing protein [Globomyces pollinis-pini]
MFKRKIPFQNQLRTFSSVKQSTTKRIFLGLGSLVCISALGYLTFNQPEEKIQSKLRSLPPVSMILPMNQVNELIKKNESFLNPNIKSIPRLDFNSLPSNNPMEDYHSEHIFNDGILLGIYDGHGGAECGKLVMDYMATYVSHHISKPIPNGVKKADHIKKAMKDAFIELDKDKINGSITTKASWFNLFERTQTDYQNILKSLRAAASGSCAMVAYVDDTDIYVASAGDCRAVLGRNRNYSKDGMQLYEAIDLSNDHTTMNPEEYRRILNEHPGEEETVVWRNRVLGGLQPTRSIGDARYKWPLNIQEIILPHLYPNGLRYIPKNYHTPPYVTAEPEVIHYQRDSADSFLILACDGLWDELSSSKSVDIVGKLLEDKYKGNYATTLMNAALSGADSGGKLEDPTRIQHHLSISAPYSRRYRDDMTINVVHLGKTIEAEGKFIENVRPYQQAGGGQLNSWVQVLKGKTPIRSKL